MTIDQAIEVKEAYHKRFSKHMLSKEREADQLGIEALKRLKDQRSGTVLDEYDFLPGETKD